MKKNDLYFIFFVVILFVPFFLSKELYDFYKEFNHNHGMVMAFVKFAVLATLGEVLGLRIRTGKYTKEGFGIAARAFYWGIFGLTIKMAFIIFATGVPNFLAYLGMHDAAVLMKQPFSFNKLLLSFSISTTMNLIYAPVLMTAHKITDTHIVANNGSFMAVFKPINVSQIITTMDWNVQWNFVFKKTIPLFWIPAHTITFLLPADFQVLFAAILGIVLGVLLAIAAVMGKNNSQKS